MHRIFYNSIFSSTDTAKISCGGRKAGHRVRGRKWLAEAALQELGGINQKGVQGKSIALSGLWRNDPAPRDQFYE